MKRTEKAARTGRGRKPRESSTTQGRDGAQAPQVAQTQAEASDSSPAPGGHLPEEAAQESIPSRGVRIEETLAKAGLDPVADVRSLRWDEKRRVLTVKTRDFAIRELVIPREMST